LNLNRNIKNVALKYPSIPPREDRDLHYSTLTTTYWPYLSVQYCTVLTEITFLSLQKIVGWVVVLVTCQVSVRLIIFYLTVRHRPQIRALCGSWWVRLKTKVKQYVKMRLKTKVKQKAKMRLKMRVKFYVKMKLKTKVKLYV
jgi:hypothetical protein